MHWLRQLMSVKWYYRVHFIRIIIIIIIIIVSAVLTRLHAKTKSLTRLLDKEYVEGVSRSGRRLTLMVAVQTRLQHGPPDNRMLTDDICTACAARLFMGWRVRGI